ncbi:MAG TPA: amidohydrolase family protein [Candidatus Binatia bacterium]|nr:amidohydrolase family protein [Candidatus Binatia bacterium]
MATGAIDIHHHYVPEQIIGEAKRHGKALGIEVFEDGAGTVRFSFNGGPKYPLVGGLTDVTPRLEMMAKGKIALAALDPSTQLLGYDLKGQQAESWCRLYNECVNEFVKKYPDRFTAMAAVPIQEPERAARVLEHAVSELKFSGAYIATNVNHRYYDSEAFDPFWAKAQELGALVFMHPDNPAGTELMGSFGLRLVCGNPADTTFSLGLMIYSGLFDRFPNLKLCTCHGGGFFPYHLGRFDQEYATGKQSTRRADRPNAPSCVSTPSAYLKNLYFDTLVYDVETLDFLRRKVGADHLLLGTDFPYALGDWLGVHKIEALDCSDTEKQAMLEGNARELLKIRG